jgi:hypothetical protein
MEVVGLRPFLFWAGREGEKVERSKRREDFVFPPTVAWPANIHNGGTMPYTVIYNSETHILETKASGNLALDEAKELISEIG